MYCTIAYTQTVTTVLLTIMIYVTSSSMYTVSIGGYHIMGTIPHILLILRTSFYSATTYVSHNPFPYNKSLIFSKFYNTKVKSKLVRFINQLPKLHEKLAQCKQLDGLHFLIHIKTLFLTITTIMFMVMLYNYNTDTSCINTVHMLYMHTVKMC